MWNKKLCHKKKGQKHQEGHWICCCPYFSGLSNWKATRFLFFFFFFFFLFFFFCFFLMEGGGGGGGSAEKKIVSLNKLLIQFWIKYSHESKLRKKTCTGYDLKLRPLLASQVLYQQSLSGLQSRQSPHSSRFRNQASDINWSVIHQRIAYILLLSALQHQLNKLSVSSTSPHSQVYHQSKPRKKKVRCEIRTRDLLWRRKTRDPYPPPPFKATNLSTTAFLMTDSICHSSLPRTVLEKVTLTTIQFRIHPRTKVNPMFQCVYISTPLKSCPYKSSATCAWSMARVAEKTRLNICANNKGADQPARTRRLISAFVVRYSSFFFRRRSVSQT